jgi:hypothetical protein
MGNIVKFNETRLPNSIKSGRFNVGVNNTSTDLTGFYNGITPILSGYTIYINKESGGPSIYAPQNDNELVGIVNSLGGSVSTATEALVWINSQSNMTVVNGNYPSIVTDGLVLNLDAGFVSSYPRSGTTWTDLSSSGNTGTLVNGPTFSGDSIVFDGVDDFISLNQVGNTTSFTYEVFLKCDNINKSQMYIGYSNIGAHYIRILGAKAFLSVSAGGQRTLTHSQTLIQGEYYHIVSIYNGIQLKIYVNNNLTVGPVINQTLAGWGTTRIGRWLDGDQRSFVGNINTLRIYNRELSANEVLQNYYAGLQRFIPTNGLVLSLDAQNTNLYATSPTTAYDISGNNNNGTLINGTQYVSDGDGSWNFDGVDDRISGTITSLSGSPFTINVWINPNSVNQVVYLFIGSVSSNNQSIHLRLTSNTTMRFGMYGDDLDGTLTPLIGNWSLITCSLDENRVQKIYQNGVLKAQRTANSMFIGNNLYGLGSWNGLQPINSKISTSQVYNRTLTQTEITTIFNATRTRYGL